MKIEKFGSPKARGPATAASGAASKPPAEPPPSTTLVPLFRRIDWITFGLTTLFVFLAYFYTLAPDLTLEDSGELAVGSYYAGVPHPPGYPIWTIFSWLFTVLLPFHNIAWRVAVSSAVSGALGCGLLALLVSRGSSMMIEGIAELKGIEQRSENLICLVAGFVGGCLLAFNGFFWSQAVIVEVYCFGVLSLMGVLCALMRWLYAPNQLRYLYLGSFLFGICLNNHQTLVVAAMGIEVAVLAVNSRVGRNLFIFNSLVYFLGLYGKSQGLLTTFDANLPLFVVYNVIGIGSVYVALWYSLKTERHTKLKLTLIHLGGNLLIWTLWLINRSKGGSFNDHAHTLLMIIYNAGGFGLLYFYYWLTGNAERIWTDWKPVGLLVLAWCAGAAFYLYMPLTSMTNPPMNWGYPRTWDGFIHAFSRGQYEKTNPTTDFWKFLNQVRMYGEGAVEEFNFAYLLIGVVPFLLWSRMQKRERSWMTGLTAIYACLAVLLLVLMNPSTDKQSRDLVKVFFTASYVMLAMWAGYGLTLITGLLLTNFAKYRIWMLYGCAAASGLAIYNLVKTFHEMHAPVLRLSALVGLGLPLAVIALLFQARGAVPLKGLLAVMSLMPLYPMLSHWAENEQRGHLFGFWFGHDMFTPPDFGKAGQFYPKMTKDAILFGGTDPGRFCPTYMIFCESFIPPQKRRDPDFDRRDVYIITQNALADGTYLNYIRAHYDRSAEIDPPFFQEMLRSPKEKEENVTTNALARAFGPIDRFFTNLGARVEARRRREGVYPPTEIYTPSPEDSRRCFEEYIADAQRRLAANQLEPGEDVRIIDNRVQVAGQVSVMQINGLLTKIIFDRNPTNEFFVEESFPLKWMFPYLTPFGIIMKINRQPVAEMTEEMVKKDHEFWSLYSQRLSGNWITYSTPIKEICDFAERVYLHGDLKGYTGDRKFLRDNDAQKAFSKLRSAIGGLYAWRLTASRQGSPEYQRMIKEADFAFRQSFAFCPYSPEAVFRYSNLLAQLGRLDDALLIAQTCQKFDPENRGVNDLVAQLLQFKRGQGTVTQAQTQLSQLEHQYMTNPQNVQAALGLANAYLQIQKIGSAMEILDRAIAQLEPQFRANPSDSQTAFMLSTAYAQRQNTNKSLEVLDKHISAIEPVYRANPSNSAAAFQLAQAYLQRQKAPEVVAVLDQVVALPNADPNTLLMAAQFYAQLGNAPKLEGVLLKLVKLVPDNAEAWYDLAALQAVLGKNAQAVDSLSRSLKLSKEHVAKQPGAKDLSATAAQDGRFQNLRQLPEFKKLVSGK